LVSQLQAEKCSHRSFFQHAVCQVAGCKRECHCAVVFNVGAGTYQVISGGADKDYYTAGDNVILRTIGFHIYDDKGNIGYGHTPGANPLDAGRGFDNDITFNDITAGADTIVFNSRGTIHKQADSAGEVYLVNNRNTSYMVGVNAIGGILLKKWNASSAAWE
jgi:hypothetical protein